MPAKSIPDPDVADVLLVSVVDNFKTRYTWTRRSQCSPSMQAAVIAASSSDAPQQRRSNTNRADHWNIPVEPFIEQQQTFQDAHGTPPEAVAGLEKGWLERKEAQTYYVRNGCGTGFLRLDLDVLWTENQRGGVGNFDAIR